MKKLIAHSLLMLTLALLLISCSEEPPVISYAPAPEYPSCSGIEPLMYVTPEGVIDCKPAFHQTCRDMKNMVGVMDKLRTLQNEQDREDFGQCVIPTAPGTSDN